MPLPAAPHPASPSSAPPFERESPTFHRAIVVANPIAGRGQASSAAAELAEGLRRAGVEVELYLTRARGDARVRVRSLERPVDLAVAVGGDGTLREVLDGLVDSEVPVAVIPMGTANVLALDLALPRDVDRVLELILAGRTVSLDAGTVHGHLSFLVSGVGFDARALRELERARNGPITKWSYAGAVLRALRGYREPRMQVEVDGTRLSGHFGMVWISNIIHYGGFLKLSRDRVLDDGRFEVYLFRRAGFTHLLHTVLRGLWAELPGGPCERMTCTRVRVWAVEPVAYHVDGDFRGETPFEFEMLPRKFRILVP